MDTKHLEKLRLSRFPGRNSPHPVDLPEHRTVVPGFQISRAIIHARVHFW